LLTPVGTPYVFGGTARGVGFRELALSSCLFEGDLPLLEVF